MQKFGEAEKFDLSEKYTLGYLIALVQDVLRHPVKRVDATIFAEWTKLMVLF